MAKRKKRADGRYSTSVTLGINLENGKPIKKIVYGYNNAELEANKRQLIEDYENNRISSKIQFINYANRFIEMRKSLICHKQYTNEKALFKNHCKDIYYLEISKIVRSDIEILLNRLNDHPFAKNKLKILLNMIFESALDDDLISKNPCRKIKTKQPKNNKKRELTDIEFYLSEIADFTDRERAYVYLLKYAGLRKEEALALTKYDFNFIDNTVSINNVLEFISNQPVIKNETKTPAGKRQIPLLTPCISFLKYYVSNLEGDYLFTSLRSGNLISEQSFKKMFASIIKKMNIAGSVLNPPYTVVGLTSHIFRHNYATMCLEAGVPIKKVQQLMGQSDTSVLLNIYAHIDSKNDVHTDKIEKHFLEIDVRIKNNISNSSQNSSQLT